MAERIDRRGHIALVTAGNGSIGLGVAGAPAGDPSGNSVELLQPAAAR